MKKWDIIIPIVAVLVLSIIGLTVQEYRGNESAAGDLESMEKKKTAVAVSGFTDSDPIGLFYHNKEVSVKGKVIKVEDNGNLRNITLNVESSRSVVTCQFQTGRKNEMDIIQPGQQISVKGICVVESPRVILVDCVVQ